MQLRPQVRYQLEKAAASLLLAGEQRIRGHLKCPGP
jgi:hypothetical protein